MAAFSMILSFLIVTCLHSIALLLDDDDDDNDDDDDDDDDDNDLNILL